MNLFRKVVDWYFSNKALPYWCILLLDCVIVAFSTYVGHYIELGGDIFAGHFWSMTRGILLGLVLFVVSFRAFHTYSSLNRNVFITVFINAIKKAIQFFQVTQSTRTTPSNLLFLIF